ncbi:uncharacterized protein Z518_08758 [Rhinocladiella mackenziei CBS 650.93]|uniref:AAR2 domain-containing protein n=1 Tax=Rhinocladiella mackenziei CBS 650.93 TaxID=1442369 RepID=A0A0D2J1N8_9EURO|nr:uncharacterized protein Z518_08758 [Rhinocladiella mackenziei CBS 650.93]KIX02815.1 hypothetical protein Z518_08758 [Rhinocladiella mackenziei CBS 650.93]
MTFIGVDLISFKALPSSHNVTNIRITNIPPGLHFLYTGTDASLSIRHGRWLNFTATKPQWYVLRWNSDAENLDLLDHDDPAAQEAIRSPSTRGLVDYAALQDATSSLATKDSREAGDGSTPPYEERRAESTDWPALTRHMSPTFLTRALSSDSHWVVSSVSSAPSDTECIPGLSHLEASDTLQQHPLNLLPINLKQTWAAGDIGRTRTDRARDRSWYLSQLIESVTPVNGDKAIGAKELLGELQFCFLMVLTLANYSCLEQWKRLLKVFLTCQNALREAEAYFVQVVKVLRLQVWHVEDVEGGLFEMRDEGGSAWLRALWGRFRDLVDEVFGDGNGEEKGAVAAAGQSLRREVDALQKLFEDRYGWQSERDILRRGLLELEDGERVEVSMLGVDEDEETGEYAPVVVET